MIKNITLDEFLEEKTLYYDKIDYDIIDKSWKILSKFIELPYVIHIIGTNGKGSTGRFIASFLYQSNQKILHYTSPHILKFNERIWIDGKDSNDEQLDIAHIRLQNILPDDILDKLTYFEYTTLLALYLSDGFDYIVLEAGLGGEYDATNVVKNNLTVVPSVGLDHVDFLGDTIEKIATTKLKSCDNAYILGEKIDKIVIKVANEILKNKKYINFNHNIELPKGYEKLAKYLQNNLKLALNCMKYLGFCIKNLKLNNMNGRMQKIQDNITIDVGHNSLAAKVIVDEFKNEQITLIYNCYKDKDYKAVLSIFKPILKKVEIIKCNDKRMVDDNLLMDTCAILDIDVKLFDINLLNNDEKYLVFGSFKVVEEFLFLKGNSEK